MQGKYYLYLLIPREFFDFLLVIFVQKNLLKKVVKEGGGRKVYMVLRGSQPIVHVSPQGEGGSKKLENWSTWFMNEPYHKILNFVYMANFQAFCQNISSSMNPLFLKSTEYFTHTGYEDFIQTEPT